MPRRILIVDDEPDVVHIIQTILKSKGYDVTGVTDGKTGLELAQRDKPDLILCDLMMPGMSGLEFIKQVRNHPKLRTTPIIALSALGTSSGKSEEFWRRGLNADDFISKPFDPLDLLGRVEFLFRRQNYLSTQDETSGANGAAANGGGNGGAASAPAQEIDLIQASPKMVVRAFVEAWNAQDFALEFRCLASEMTGGLSEREYVGRRRQCYVDENGSERTQRIRAFLEDSTSHNASKVVCEREDTFGGRRKLRKETYVLRKGADGWKIVSMRSVPLAPGTSREPTNG